MSNNHTTTTANLADAVTRAIATMLDVKAGEGEGAGATIVFSGEGRTPADATRDAVADIIAQRDAHQCSPQGIAVDGTMRTEEGYRIWGSLGCGEDSQGRMPVTEIPEFDITEGEGGRWTLTLGKE